MRKQVKTFRLSEADQAVLAALAGELGTNDSDTLRAVIADGLRYRMMQNDPPVHSYFVETLTPEAVVADYLEFLDAVRDRAGLMGPDGKKPRFYFAKVPKGGKWEANGVAGGWAVLPKSMSFTKDGYNKIEFVE